MNFNLMKHQSRTHIFKRTETKLYEDDQIAAICPSLAMQNVMVPNAKVNVFFTAAWGDL